MGLFISEIGSNLFVRHPSGLWYLLPLGIFSIMAGHFLYRKRRISHSLKEREPKPLYQKEDTPVDRVYKEIIRLVSEIFKPHTVALFRRDRDDLVLEEGVSQTPLFQRDKRLKMGEDMVGLVRKEKKPILIEDFFQDATTLGYYKEDLPIRCFLGVPIILGGETEWVLVIDSRERGVFTEKEKKSLVSLSHMFGLVLDLLRYRSEKEEEISHLSKLSKLSSKLLTEIKKEKVIESTFNVMDKIFKPEKVCFASVDESSQRGDIDYCRGEDEIEKGFSFSLDEGIVGWIARNKSPFIEGDLSKKRLYRFSKVEPKSESQSFLGAPVREKEFIIGVLWIERREPNAFKRNDVEILCSIADTLALALIRARLYEEIQDMADRDGLLTSLYNRRKFKEILADRLQEEKELVLIIFDIDHFKSINDDYGHDYGDEVLKGIAQVLLSFREGIAARYGGEEFAFILPGYSKEEGIEIAERIRSRVKGLSFTDKKISVTLSAGLSHFPLDARERDKIITKADNALLTAKREGRDKLVVSS